MAPTRFSSSGASLSSPFASRGPRACRWRASCSRAPRPRRRAARVSRAGTTNPQGVPRVAGQSRLPDGWWFSTGKCPIERRTAEAVARTRAVVRNPMYRSVKASTDEGWDLDLSSPNRCRRSEATALSGGRRLGCSSGRARGAPLGGELPDSFPGSGVLARNVSLAPPFHSEGSPDEVWTGAPSIELCKKWRFIFDCLRKVARSFPKYR